MTKDVLVSISGAHTLDGDSDDISVITAGSYYYKNGKHFIIYDEVVDVYKRQGLHHPLPSDAADLLYIDEPYT